MLIINQPFAGKNVLLYIQMLMNLSLPGRDTGASLSVGELSATGLCYGEIRMDVPVYSRNSSSNEGL